MKINIIESQIQDALPKIEKGLNQYCWLQKRYNIEDVSKNIIFQTKFNAFYRVRRNELWRSEYYHLFEKSKSSPISFENILNNIYDFSHRIEASFASKLLATIQPDFPILDKFVLENTNLALPKTYEKNRLEKTIIVYDTLVKQFSDFSKTDNAKYLFRAFCTYYPHVKISETKMIDFILWQTR